MQAPSFFRIFTELFFFCLISDLFEIEERITFKAFWVSVCANWSNLVFSSISSSKRLWFRISSWSRLKSWSSLSGSKLAMSVSLYSTSSGKSLIDCILPLDCLSFIDYLISPIFVMLLLISMNALNHVLFLSGVAVAAEGFTSTTVICFLGIIVNTTYTAS